METVLACAVLVALAEMGDRTQLLAILLAVRHRRPVAILAGILVATLANHLLAALAGFYVGGLLTARWFRYAVAGSFIAMGLWALFPDRSDETGAARRKGRSVFLTTVVSFFLVEIGDKTQIATLALAARFHDIVLVVAGTTAGMMAANIPAVLLGRSALARLPLRALRVAAALAYVVLGLWALASAAGWTR